MDPRVSDSPESSRYELRVEGDLAGFLAYHRAPEGTVRLDHTEVDPNWRGQGLGSVLIGGVLDDLRRRGRRVVPRCPFVRSYIRDHTEYRDLVPEEHLHLVEADH